MTTEPRTIHEAARWMKMIQAERMPSLSLGTEVAIHRPADPTQVKWKLVKGEWVPR